MNEETKTCSKCLKSKSTDAFYTHKQSRDGLRHECKECVKRMVEINQLKNLATQHDYTIEFQKQCYVCKQTKSSFDFTKARRKKSGLSDMCSACSTAMNKALEDRRVVNNQTLNIDPTYSKRCSECKAVKHNSSFRINRRRPDGLHSMCKPCSSIIERQCRENRKAINSASPPQVSTKKCAICKLTLAASEFNKRLEITDGLNCICKECQSNKVHERRSSMLSAVEKEHDRATSEFIRELKSKYDYCCGYCGKRPDVLHIDHIYPLSKGGKHIKSNLMPACPNCNLRKSSKLPEKWFKEIGMPIPKSIKQS